MSQLENVQGFIPNRGVYNPKMFATINLKKIKFAVPKKSKPIKITPNASDVAGFTPNRAPYAPRESTTGITSSNLETKKEEVDASIALRKSIRNDITANRMGESMNIEKRVKNFSPLIESLNNLGLTTAVSQTFMPDEVAKVILNKVSEFSLGKTPAEFSKALPDVMRQIANDLKSQMLSGVLKPNDFSKIIAAIKTAPDPVALPPPPPPSADPKDFIENLLRKNLRPYNPDVLMDVFLIPRDSLSEFEELNTTDEFDGAVIEYLTTIGGWGADLLTGAIYDRKDKGLAKAIITKIKALGDYVVDEVITTSNVILIRRGSPEFQPKFENSDLTLDAIFGGSPYLEFLRDSIESKNRDNLFALFVPDVLFDFFLDDTIAIDEKIFNYDRNIVDWIMLSISSVVNRGDGSALAERINIIPTFYPRDLVMTIIANTNQLLAFYGAKQLDEDLRNVREVAESISIPPWVQIPLAPLTAGSWIEQGATENTVKILGRTYKISPLISGKIDILLDAKKAVSALKLDIKGLPRAMFAAAAQILAGRYPANTFGKVLMATKNDEDVLKGSEFLRHLRDRFEALPDAQRAAFGEANPEALRLINDAKKPPTQIGLGRRRGERRFLTESSLSRPPQRKYVYGARRALFSNDVFNLKSETLDKLLKRGKITERQYVRGQQALAEGII